MPDSDIKPIFAIENGFGAVLGLLKDGDDFVLTASHLAVPSPMATQIWTRAELIGIRNAINKALNRRA